MHLAFSVFIVSVGNWSSGSPPITGILFYLNMNRLIETKCLLNQARIKKFKKIPLISKHVIRSVLFPFMEYGVPICVLI